MSSALGWDFICFAMIFGYALSVVVETPVLMVGLSALHPIRRRFLSGLWLTACTYPFVVMVIPRFIDPCSHGILYKSVTETIVPIAECTLFYLVYRSRTSWTRATLIRDMLVIAIANLTSFGVGELFTLVLRSLP